jgi:hypothetical protein
MAVDLLKAFRSVVDVTVYARDQVGAGLCDP